MYDDTGMLVGVVSSVEVEEGNTVSSSTVSMVLTSIRIGTRVGTNRSTTRILAG